MKIEKLDSYGGVKVSTESSERLTPQQAIEKGQELLDIGGQQKRDKVRYAGSICPRCGQPGGLNKISRVYSEKVGCCENLVDWQANMVRGFGYIEELLTKGYTLRLETRMTPTEVCMERPDHWRLCVLFCNCGEEGCLKGVGYTLEEAVLSLYEQVKRFGEGLCR